MDAGHAILEVLDHGIGIPPEQVARLFEAYMQLDAALPRAGGGLGLGLALVHGIVEAHGGTIRIASDERARGTRVTVRLRTTG